MTTQFVTAEGAGVEGSCQLDGHVLPYADPLLLRALTLESILQLLAFNSGRLHRIKLNVLITRHVVASLLAALPFAGLPFLACSF